MKKTKLPGDNISLKTKKSEDPAVMQWINAQTNLMDSLRYLIENEINQSGVRNLQAYIPTERSTLNSSGSAQLQTLNNGALSANRELAAGSVSPEDSAAPAGPEQPDSPNTVEDEFDDEDIEAWT